MNTFITLLVLLLSTSCTTSKKEVLTIQEIPILTNKQPITAENIKSKNSYTIKDEDYTLHFTVKKIDSKNAILIMEMKLYNNAYYVSPNDLRDMKGKLKLDFGSYKDIEFNGEIIATPPFDPNKEMRPRAENDKTNYYQIKGAITENTVYKLPLKIKVNGDFDVIGRIRFVIEPRCTMEQHPIKIIYKSGEFEFGDPKC